MNENESVAGGKVVNQVASTKKGWMGVVRAVTNYLRVVGADQDADGRFILVTPKGSGLVSFMGLPLNEGSDVIVPGNVQYLVGGHPSNLALGLSSTSSGLSIYVI